MSQICQGVYVFTCVCLVKSVALVGWVRVRWSACVELKELEVGSKNTSCSLLASEWASKHPKIHIYQVCACSCVCLFRVHTRRALPTHKHSRIQTFDKCQFSLLHSSHTHTLFTQPDTYIHINTSTFIWRSFSLMPPVHTQQHTGFIVIDTTQHDPLSGHAVWTSGGSIERYPSL